MRVSLNNQPILIVEDSPDDFEATQRALQRDGGIANPIVHCENGQSALDYVLKSGPEGAPAPPPGLVLLDLNMSGIDGRQVLTSMKGDPRTRSIPVVVLTTSDDDWDINRCYELGANSYIKKPVGLEGFFTAVQSLKDYWLEVSILPRT